MNLSFEPLSKERLEEALSLATRVFPNNTQRIEIAYEASLDPNHHYWEERRRLSYFIVIDKGTDKIVSLTGLYNRKEYPEDEVWLGWFCTDPDVRGKGVGRKTLEWSIQKAREMGYKKFKLYTSTDPNEAAAQDLYESVGLKIYKREPSKDFENEELLYRSMNL